MKCNKVQLDMGGDITYIFWKDFICTLIPGGGVFFLMNSSGSSMKLNSELQFVCNLKNIIVDLMAN